MSDARRAGPVVVDVQALQAPGTRTRGIGRFVAGLVTALERHHRELVGTYLLNPELAPPAPLPALYGSGKLAWRSDRGAIGPKARVVHLCSPLDPELGLEALWPEAASGLALSATVYDLIPARDLEQSFVDEGARRRYRTRLELVRAAAGLQVLSHAVARDLTELLGVAPGRITTVGAGIDDGFGSRPRAEARAVALESLAGEGLCGPFVCYPSGSHPRKNNEALVEAFARVAPEARSGLQLVISGELDDSTRHHLTHLAARLGIGGSVVVPGYLGEDLYEALVRGAELVCFPSLDEGFGLPVAEAIACGTPVTVADIPALAELVEPAARFDPTSPESIAAGLSRALRRIAKARPAEHTGAPRPSWEAVARRVASALGDLAGRPRAPRRRPRERLALVSPFPPSPSGVAAYSEALAGALASAGDRAVVLFGDGPTTDQSGPDGAPVHPYRALRAHEALEGRFDHVVYTLGNSHHHLGALRLLRERPGVVIAHDVRLSNLYRHLHGDPGVALGGLGREVAAMYGGGLPEGLGATGALDERDLERYGVLMAREAIERSQSFLVSSAAAADLALSDAGAGLAERIAVLPFAFFAPDAAPAFVEEARPVPEGLGPSGRAWGASPPPALVGPVVCSFGIVDPIKAPDLALEALSGLHARAVLATLALVGPVSDDLARALARQAEALGLSEHLVLTGPLEPDAYRAWLARADLAVQLRRTFNGEASAALGECLAAGVATVVGDSGFAAELPRDAVARWRAADGSGELSAVVAGLLADAPWRERLGRAGRAHARARTFAVSAAALLEVLEARGTRPAA